MPTEHVSTEKYFDGQLAHESQVAYDSTEVGDSTELDVSTELEGYYRVGRLVQSADASQYWNASIECDSSRVVL